MQINKITNVSNVGEIVSNVKGNRVFLNSPVDTFVRSDNSNVKNKNFLEKIKENLMKSVRNENKNAAFNMDSVIDDISKEYPDLDKSDIKKIIERLQDNLGDPKAVIRALDMSADELSKIYKTNVSEIENKFVKTFGEMDSVEKVSARSKGKNSVFSKLISKFSKGKLASTELTELAKGIGDGYGARVVLKDLNTNDAKIALSKVNMTYDDFVKDIQNIDKLDPATYKNVKRGLDKLKEAQSGEFFDRFIKLIKKGGMELADDEFNNYGSELTSYFSDSQLLRLAHAYEAKTGKPLAIVNKMDLQSVVKNAQNVGKKTDVASVVDTHLDKAVKQSGYTTTQANLKTSYTTGEKLADMELQIRGSHVNDFAEIEHVPYDIRQGKITNPIYDEIKNVMRGMSEDSYKEYSKYLSDTYQYHRLNELGVHIPKPELSKNLVWADLDKLPDDLKNVVKPNQKIDSSTLSKITEEGLLSLHH